MEPIPLVLEEEIALEGLDGITLESKKLRNKFYHMNINTQFF